MFLKPLYRVHFMGVRLLEKRDDILRLVNLTSSMGTGSVYLNDDDLVRIQRRKRVNEMLKALTLR